MKILLRTIQVIVGILFIVSGLVKANDPLGLSYKMEEFFEIWNASLLQGEFFAKNILTGLFDFLHKFSLSLSVAMITLEIVAGIALILGWQKKMVLWLLLVLIVFFTFLTGYAYLSVNPDGSPKFTNCGCFGDCLPISPKTSFLKDIALLLMIAILLFGKKYLFDIFTTRRKNALLIGSLLVSLLLQWYVLNYLPFVDCLPFKQGKNIGEQMKQPPGSYGDSTAIRYIYEKEGKRYEWDWNELPADFATYTYIDRIDRLVRKGNAEPPIKNFSLMGNSHFDSSSGNSTTIDSTAIVLAQPIAIIGFGLGSSARNEMAEPLKHLAEEAAKNKIPLYFATNERDRLTRFFAGHKIDIQVFSCDFTNIRTAARTQPTFYLLKSGTIEKKFSYRQLNDLKEEIKKR